MSRLQAAATAPSAPGPASSAAGNVESNIARLYRSRVHDSVSGKETKTIELDVPMVPVAGDIKIEFFHKDKFKNVRFLILNLNSNMKIKYENVCVLTRANVF